MLSFNFIPQQRRVHTKTIMQLPNPRRPRILYRRVQKDNLVLYLDLMQNRLQRHMSLHELLANHQSLLTTKEAETYLLLLHPLFPPPLTRNIPNRQQVPPSIAIIDPIKLGTPHLNDMRQPLEKAPLDPLV